jgi:hypothetical protein
MIRIANGQGFWGDWLEAPVRLVEQGPIDYLALDYLAEITMSIVQKQKQENPALGYARDFPPLIGRIAKRMRERNIKVIANAGGVNPIACAREVRRLAPDLKVAVVLGDDVLDRLDEFAMKNMDTGEPLSAIRTKIMSANAYIGAFPLVEALDTGADVIIAGRCTDTALTLAPMIHQFGWRETDWDLLASGTIAGHIIECGAQCTGGNCMVNWQSIPDMANIGYPIVEAESDGSFTVTKHEGTGGRVHSDVVKEQLLYELGDPKQYITPDCVADFTSIHLEDTGSESGAGERHSWRLADPVPQGVDQLRLWLEGHRNTCLLLAASDREGACRGQVVRQRLTDLGLKFEALESEIFGLNACHGQAAPSQSDPSEVQLRIGVRDADRKAVDRFTRELIPLVLNGPPTATGFGDGRPPVREVVAYWPALVPRELIQTKVEVVE